MSNLLKPTTGKVIFTTCCTLLWVIVVHVKTVPFGIICRNGPIGCEGGDVCNETNYEKYQLFKHPCACECVEMKELIYQYGIGLGKQIVIAYLAYSIGSRYTEKYTKKRNKR